MTLFDKKSMVVVLYFGLIDKHGNLRKPEDIGFVMYTAKTKKVFKKLVLDYGGEL